uniref:Uncharacterized protein n=1 Tax=Fagus sylvatica TaxID=28930 RepID=A0A2N9G3Z1_FAGSY
MAGGRVAEKALDIEAAFGLGLLEHDDVVDEGDQESSAELEVDLGLAWSDHGSMARIATQWLRGSDLEMVLARDLSSILFGLTWRLWTDGVREARVSAVGIFYPRVATPLTPFLVALNRSVATLWIDGVTLLNGLMETEDWRYSGSGGAGGA